MSQTNKLSKEGKLALLFVIFFVLLALVTIVFVASECYVHKFFGHRQTVSSDAVKALDQEREERAMRAGLSKMIAGRIESIDKDQKSFVVDIDPLGDHKTYVISTVNGTGYLMMANEDFTDQATIGEEIIREPEMTKTEFKFLEVGRSVEVHFVQRIDVDIASRLVAQKIVILPN